MSNDQHNLQVIKESPKDQKSKPLDLNDIEMIFGTPKSPKTAQPDVHRIANETKHGREPQTNHNKQVNDSDTETVSTQPLLEPDKARQLPPLAGPEIDDLDDEANPTHHSAPFPGIDDGLLEPGDKIPGAHEGHDDDSKHEKEGENGVQVHSSHDDGTDEGKWFLDSDERDGPTFHDGPNGFGPRFGVDDRPVSPFPGSIPDVNTYQQKKNLAQGMMDLALLSANANQLRYVLESSTSHPYYYPSLVFISLSIVFQIAVGVGLIMNSRYDVKDDKDICKADKINNMTVLGIFLITIVNVFITSFSVASPTTTVVQQAG